MKQCVPHSHRMQTHFDSEQHSMQTHLVSVQHSKPGISLCMHDTCCEQCAVQAQSHATIWYSALRTLSHMTQSSCANTPSPAWHLHTTCEDSLSSARVDRPAHSADRHLQTIQSNQNASSSARVDGPARSAASAASMACASASRWNCLCLSSHACAERRRPSGTGLPYSS